MIVDNIMFKDAPGAMRFFAAIFACFDGLPRKHVKGERGDQVRIKAEKF